MRQLGNIAKRVQQFNLHGEKIKSGRKNRKKKRRERKGRGGKESKKRENRIAKINRHMLKRFIYTQK